VSSTIAPPNSGVRPVLEATGWLLQIGGDDIATRVDVFEQIFLVFMLLGTLVGIVVITYTLYNAYHYRSGNESADETTDRPVLGELPTGANKGGRKLFLSFGLSAIIVVSLIAWTYGMLLFVEGGGNGADPENATEVDVEGVYPRWSFTYDDDDRIPNAAAEQLVIAAQNDSFTTIQSVEEIENRDLHTLVDEVQAEATEIENDDDRSLPEDFSSFALSTKNVGTTSDLRVPVNEQIYLNVTGDRLWHNFGIPEQNVKADAIPGQYTETWFVADEPGTYRIECFELCGSQHSQMVGTLIVNETSEFTEWYDGRTANATEISENPTQFYDPQPETNGSEQSIDVVIGPASQETRTVDSPEPTTDHRVAPAVTGAASIES
jgi:cytochrome c oxidase subunit 2